MRRLNAQTEKLLRRRMERLSPERIDFHVYIRDRRLFRFDGVELTDGQAIMVVRAVKRAMRELSRAHLVRRALAVATVGGRLDFTIHDDVMHGADGGVLGFGPGLSALADQLGRQENARWRSARTH